MRAIGIGLIMLAGAALAAPVGHDEPAGAPGDRAAAGFYSSQMLSITQEISDKYVRPVSRVDLLEAALKGLYEGARQPLPPGLRRDLELATTEAELHQVVTRARRQAGNAEHLAEYGLLASIRAVPRALDPYCGLVALSEFQRGGAGRYGFGFELAGDDDPVALAAGLGPPVIPGVRVNTPLPATVPQRAGPLRVGVVHVGGPAQQAGLRPGDRVTHIGGKEVDAAGSAELQRQMLMLASLHDMNLHTGDIAPVSGKQQEPGLELTVRRAGRDGPLPVRIKAAYYAAESVFGVNRLPDNGWNFLLDPKDRFGYVRVGPLNENTATELQGALAALHGAGARGLVLDLRWCPGGMLTASTTVARMFLKKGLIAQVMDRSDQVSQAYSAEDSAAPLARAGDYPVVVIVNGETSGGGELIAAALQDHKRASVTGQRTVGKASVQTPIMLPVASLAFKATSGKFTRPNGKNLNRSADSTFADDWGVRPDPGLELPITPELSQQLKEWHQLQALRPGASREALPLDDPANDPQRQAAVRELQRRIK
jgi:C-terminal peptidase prc